MEKFKKICVDANTAVGQIGYACSEVACIYPITPSSPMAEVGDELASSGKKNIFGRTTKIVEMQSEAGAAGAVHGSLAGGALTTTFTASQGLLLMIPNMYKIAGEALPCVFHVSARCVAAHALNIFGDHSDVMACRQTGFCMLASNNVQEAHDFALIAHVATLKASLPFLHFFDGFRTSHEINKIDEIPAEVISKMLPIKEIEAFRKRAHNPTHPTQSGTAQNPDIFFQNREACNPLYDKAYKVVEETMNEFGKLTGRKYKPFEYVGPANAKDVIVAMCSACEAAEAAMEVLNKKYKQSVGVLKVRLYRPFNASAFVKALPKTVKNISVLDRTKEPGALGEPLFQDVVAALKEFDVKANVYGGRYGLGGKDFRTSDVAKVVSNMNAKKPIKHFSVGITDDVTRLSLPVSKYTMPNPDCYEMLFYGLGSDGTVSANKSSIKICGLNTKKYVQGYFEYDSKKSGSLTTSHLRISDKPIKMPFFVKKADFIAIHKYTFVHEYDILKCLKPNGKVLLNTNLTEEQLGRDLPVQFKKYLKENKAELYIVPADKIAREIGLKNRTNTIMQACFFKIANIIPFDLAQKQMKDFAIKAYGKKGQAVIDANLKAVDVATTDLVKCDVKSIINAKTQSFMDVKKASPYYKKFVEIIEKRNGDSLPVSAFDSTGTVPTGTTQYEKRGIALDVPCWVSENCIQCGQCTMVCPHAAIRPYLMDSNVKKPSSLKTKPALGIAGKEYVVQVSPLDCTGCNSCVNVCPAKNKALVSKPLADVKKEQVANYEFCNTLPPVANIPFKADTIKGAQFLKPYFEFSGACAGCGETPYIRLATQLFGKNMMIANATGCSSIYGGSAPTCPYSQDSEGCGPSWANSLFEDNAEFGYGMYLATKTRRQQAYEELEAISSMKIDGGLQAAIAKMKETKDSPTSNLAAKELISALEKAAKNSDGKTKKAIENALKKADLYAKKSQWIIGGDGWAYDIGYGGLDHVLASGENINVLVLDTEVYSNTGGQSSKSTPTGSVAKFASAGKGTRKKDLGMMAMAYKNVYVAQVAMGANPQQLINALVEAESYNGPSIVICYAPCINHGTDLSKSQAEEKKAVMSGYWTLYRYDPRKEVPMQVDSVDPTIPYNDFLMGETRYASLNKKNPERAKVLFAEAEAEAASRRATYKEMANKK